MKKIFLVLIICFYSAFFSAISAKEVLSPALQLNLEEYKNYFKKSSDYKVDLKSRYDYKITCEPDIIGVVWEDTENIKMFDVKDEITGEIIDMKSVILKIKYETYTYIRLYTSTREIINIMVSVNPVFDNEINKSLGLCRIEPYRG